VFEWAAIDAAHARLTYPIDEGLLDEALLVINEGLT
jgi:hypothetical protein